MLRFFLFLALLVFAAVSLYRHFKARAEKIKNNLDYYVLEVRNYLASNDLDNARQAAEAMTDYGHQFARSPAFELQMYYTSCVLTVERLLNEHRDKQQPVARRRIVQP